MAHLWQAQGMHGEHHSIKLHVLNLWSSELGKQVTEDSCREQTVAVARACAPCTACPLIGRCLADPSNLVSVNMGLLQQLLLRPASINNIPAYAVLILFSSFEHFLQQALPPWWPQVCCMDSCEAHLMPGIVKDVSATLVATTINLWPAGGS